VSSNEGKTATRAMHYGPTMWLYSYLASSITSLAVAMGAWRYPSALLLIYISLVVATAVAVILSAFHLMRHCQHCSRRREHRTASLRRWFRIYHGAKQLTIAALFGIVLVILGTVPPPNYVILGVGSALAAVFLGFIPYAIDTHIRFRADCACQYSHAER
jgi:putative flippase GtrA